MVLSSQSISLLIRLWAVSVFLEQSVSWFAYYMSFRKCGNSGRVMSVVVPGVLFGRRSPDRLVRRDGDGVGRPPGDAGLGLSSYAGARRFLYLFHGGCDSRRRTKVSASIVVNWKNL